MKGPAGPFIFNPQGPKRPENSPVDCFQRRPGGSPRRVRRRGPKRPENLPLGWFSAEGGPEGPGQAAESRKAAILWQRLREHAQSCYNPE